MAALLLTVAVGSAVFAYKYSLRTEQAENNERIANNKTTLAQEKTAAPLGSLGFRTITHVGPVRTGANPGRGWEVRRAGSVSHRSKNSGR